MSGKALRVGAVLEGPSDNRTISALLRRLLPGTAIELVGLDATSPFLRWSRVSKEARGRVPPRHGHFNGEPAVEDAVTAVLALRLFRTLREPPDAVVLVRDSDGKPKDRRKGLDQARRDAPWSFAVVIGVAHHMCEAWVLAAFVPVDQAEKRALAAERQRLGFDPTTQPELLEAKDEHAKRSPKRVLTALVSDDPDRPSSNPEREIHCIEEAPLSSLRERGQEAGLSDFVDDVEERLQQGPEIADPP